MSQWQTDRRNLTDDEIKALSFELKLCYCLMGWNVSAKIKTVDDWAEKMGPMFSDEGDQSDIEGIERAKMKVDDMIKFFEKYGRD